MTFEEAVSDPRRPLSMSPRDWMLSVEAELEEEKDLVEGSISRIEQQDSSRIASSEKIDGWVKIDIGIDQIIEGCKMLESGIWETNRKDLNKEQRAVIDSIQDIFSSAIVPYMADIIKESEKIK